MYKVNKNARSKDSIESTIFTVFIVIFKIFYSKGEDALKIFVYIFSACLLVIQSIVNMVIYFWAFADFFAKYFPQFSIPIAFLLYFFINLIITSILTFIIHAAEA